MQLELLKRAVLLGFKSVCDEEIQRPLICIGFDLLVPPFPIQIAEPLP